jgi:hypothetical protein
MLRQKPSDRFDVLRRCIRKENPDLLDHPPNIFVIIEEYNNDLRVKFRAERIDHDRPRFVGGRLSPQTRGLVADEQHFENFCRAGRSLSGH